MSESMADFEKEIEASFRTLNEGDVVEGTITAVNEDSAYADINYHAQGIIKKADFSDDPAFSIQSVKAGDPVKAVVLSADDGEGNVALSVKEASRAQAWDTVQKYMDEKTVIPVTIGGIVNKGVVTYVEGLRGFIPASHLDIGFVEDTNEYLGKEVEAEVITVDRKKNRLVLSVKNVLFRKRREEKEARINAIEAGSILTGKVETLKEYGAFIDLGDGVSGLCHISKIARKRIETPGEVLTEGQEVKVKVLKVENGKISLSIRDAQERGDRPERKDRDGAPRRRENGPSSYKDEGSVTTGLGALLKDIKLD
ncbi:MAG: S1 RNA-binding domain-containing protein [Eubacterium sp.]|nr:S1 RNA-binding domain-containing protein [Eubacterium sp.]